MVHNIRFIPRGILYLHEYIIILLLYLLCTFRNIIVIIHITQVYSNRIRAEKGQKMKKWEKNLLGPNRAERLQSLVPLSIKYNIGSYTHTHEYKSSLTGRNEGRVRDLINRSHDREMRICYNDCRGESTHSSYRKKKKIYRCHDNACTYNTHVYRYKPDG